MKEKKVNIALKEDVHSHAKIISVLKKMSMNDYLAECIEKSMKDDMKILESLLPKNAKK